MSAPVVVVGAGVAGLCCALDLRAAGVPVAVLEASDGVGGRVRTDVLDGFRLDRGFQVLLTAYPEVRRRLDLAALALRPLFPGARVRFGGRFHRVADPWRRPARAILGLLSPIGTLGDKRRVGRLRAEVRARDPDALLSGEDRTAAAALAERGFSPSIVERFFRPFFSGVFLERDLATSSRLLTFLFRAFASGDVAVPALGMGEVSRALAAGLEPGVVRLRSRVEAVAEGRVVLEGGEPLAARAVVVATEGDEAAALLGLRPVPWNGVTCFQFAADRDPLGEPVLLLNAEPGAYVNDAVVLSAASPACAPPGRALVVASVPGTADADEARARAELRSWWGPQVDGWRLLRACRIRRALPAFRSPAPPPRPAAVRPGLFVAGDHATTPTLDGAMRSGGLAAAAVLKSLRGGR